MKGGNGFGMVPKWVRGHLTANEIAVYVALTWRMGAGGSVFPSHDTIAEDAGMSTSTAQRTLKALKAKGLVTWENRSRNGGGKTSNTYSVSVTKPAGWVESDRSEGPIPPVRGTDEVDTPKDASSSKKASDESKANAASRAQRDRFAIDVEHLAEELDEDTDATSLMATWWEGGGETLVEAALDRVHAKGAIDPNAYLAGVLANHKTTVGKAHHMLQLVGAKDD